MRLPEPIERLLDPGIARPPRPDWDAWRTVNAMTHGPLPVVDFEEGELRPWNAGPYEQDVPKR